MSHACGNSSVMPHCSNQRTSERAQLLSAMTHPSTVLNLDAKQSFVTPIYIYTYNKRKGVLVARYKLHVTSEVEIFSVICQQKDYSLPIISIIIHFYLQIASPGS